MSDSSENYNLNEANPRVFGDLRSLVLGILFITIGLLAIGLTVNQGFLIVTEESNEQNETIEEFDVSVYIFVALIIGLFLLRKSFSAFDKEERKRIQKLTQEKPSSDAIKANDVFSVAADLKRDLTIISNVLFIVGSVSIFSFLVIIQNYEVNTTLLLFAIFLIMSYFALMILVLYLRSKRIRIEMLSQPLEDAISEL